MAHAHIDRIDSIIQFALLTAGENDDRFDRQLGPIHLIKYVYLADIAFAARNDGQTYTGLDWRFYKFGPWAPLVHERIDYALAAIGATQERFESDYGDRDDWVRWSATNATLLDQLGRRLPLPVAGSVRKGVRAFGKDTAALLEHVYQTKPMLMAAPNEYLDFRLTVSPAVGSDALPHSSSFDRLSAKRKKQFRERLAAIYGVAERRGKRSAKLVVPGAAPRYDAVYSAGLSWLDGLAGAPLPEADQTAEFSDDIWKSPARTDDDVSG